MFNIGLGEILLVLVVAFVIVGPDDLPKVARWLGRQLRRLRTLIRDIKAETGWDEVEKEVREVQRDVKQTMREMDVTADLKDAVKDVQGELKSISRDMEKDVRQLDREMKQDAQAMDREVREALRPTDEARQEAGRAVEDLESALDAARDAAMDK